MSSTSTEVTAHPAFKSIRQETIDSLNIRVEQYEHERTGAMHYHLASENTENVFLVALRTVPQDSTGVAHILEHTALCGSKNYPVRDPFFMMLRRSLNTFMNAFTSSDWTAYPFASQNSKDFNNLLQVYLDAVFFSRLDPLDFSQEGHRVEFSEPANPDSDLVFKGVVFNEMKGAMSSISSVLWSKLCHHLFPSSTYHYNSGGDPEHIPDLSYEQLQQFYRSHYHPSNAIFMTFGNIAAHTHQTLFETKALGHFDRLPQKIQVQPETRLLQPLRVDDCYALDSNETIEAKTHVVIGWMLGESSDLTQLLEAQLLSSVLLDNSASPLQQALETTNLGYAPSPLCGLEDSMREMVFCCGIEGSEPQHAEALEKLVFGVIETIAREGVSQDRLDAVLHQLELHQREITGDGYPYGLQLILQALGCATHYSDPIAVLNLDPVIADLRTKIQDPHYISVLARRLLLDNPHRVTLVVAPDKQLSDRKLALETARLADMKAAMTEEQRVATVQLAADLSARQSQIDDDSILPRVELGDVPASLPEVNAETVRLHNLPFTIYGQGTNGIVYHQAVMAIPRLDDAQLQTLPLYANMLTEVGVGGATYIKTQQRQATNVGSITAFSTMRASITDEQAISAHFTLSSKALLRNATGQTKLMYDTLHHVQFDEIARIRELVSQQRARRDQSITGNGHSLAMTAACAGMSPLARLHHQQSGLAGIRQLRALDDSLNNDSAMQNYAGQLTELHATIIDTPMQFLVIADKDQAKALAHKNSEIWSTATTTTPGAKFSLPSVRERSGALWMTNTQVNFCARAYPTVTEHHTDAAALAVLGGFLRNGFLHRAIREQGGAYGGGATQDSGIGAFRFYSYRDPRLTETLLDFDRSVAWMLDASHDHRALEEAILGVVGNMDKPSSPAGEAKQHFHNNLFARTHAMREAFRQRILAVTLDDLRRVTETYLLPELASTAIITHAGQGKETEDIAQQLDLVIEEL